MAPPCLLFFKFNSIFYNHPPPCPPKFPFRAATTLILFTPSPCPMAPPSPVFPVGQLSSQFLLPHVFLVLLFIKFIFFQKCPLLVFLPRHLGCLHYTLTVSVGFPSSGPPFFFLFSSPRAFLCENLTSLPVIPCPPFLPHMLSYPPFPVDTVHHLFLSRRPPQFIFFSRITDFRFSLAFGLCSVELLVMM